MKKNSSTKRIEPALAPLSRRSFVFKTRTGVRNVVVSEGMIRGSWKPYGRLLRIDNNDDALWGFVNVPGTEDSIRHFTKRYGPIAIPFEANGEFQFSVEEWRRAQREFRERWDNLLPRSDGRVRHAPFDSLAVAPGEAFQFSFDDLTYVASTLERLLILELYAQPRERLRKCAQPGCEQPYFLTNRVQRAYCSNECAKSKQREYKRNWWNDVGRHQRRKSKKAGKPK